MTMKLLTEKKLQKLLEEHSLKAVRDNARYYENEILKKQTELLTLQNQINPHFLYNALECIRAQAVISDMQEIADITYALSNFFRYSISTKSDFATLNDEVNVINNYMKIQQYRFRDRFCLNVDLPDTWSSIMDAVIPKLTLQPIVENSIVHAFTESADNGVINIEIIPAKKHINIRISDNGKGIDSDTLKMLNHSLKQEYYVSPNHGKRSTGIALWNVNRRLKLVFGDRYGLHVSSTPALGTDVEIHIPYISVKSDDFSQTGGNTYA
ncbi:two-component system sensor histidine kinase YesM [[Clostridium] celerecrescens 18A]|uniref:Two-component system sensor histidine kinase YesM n=2 Tax=Lacrimispora celerecrescens TaxID=29354 RepID=A0A2M8Z2K3_9FIRM|nr:two-component system sensor histidine kinase YesM [[Clostridium] celerecrescens 18A]